LATLHGVVFDIFSGPPPTKNSLHGILLQKPMKNNMLDRRFAIAPMMDWVESFLKSNS
jgi:hypothetical protein